MGVENPYIVLTNLKAIRKAGIKRGLRFVCKLVLLLELIAMFYDVIFYGICRNICKFSVGARSASYRGLRASRRYRCCRYTSGIAYKSVNN